MFEPKWDGFRAIVFRHGSEVYIQSRDGRPLDRYFPELHDALKERLPAGCVIDGEIIIVTPAGLSFDALQLRLHPAASRIKKLATETAASFVANTIRAFAPKMVPRMRGRIIVLSSMQGKHGTKDASSYSHLRSNEIGGALKLGQYNIAVNAVIPGLVDTALTRYNKRLVESIGETGHKPPSNPTPQQAWDERAPTVSLKAGWRQPDDISPAAVFLASDAAAMITGAEYEATGGDSAKDI